MVVVVIWWYWYKFTMNSEAQPLLLTELAEGQQQAVAAVLRLGKDEMNFAEFPITLLTDRVPAGQKIIEYQDQIYEERSGRTITRSLTVKPAEGTGLPTAVDDDVILALIQLTKATNGFSSRTLAFSRLDLIRMLGWPDSGASYRRLTTSLTRWLGVTLVYENAWWDKRQQAWTTKGFHIIDNFELNDSRAGSGQDDTFPSTITWNQTVFESFESGYLKSIDYDLYMNLKHPTAKRMYRFLSKRMYHKPDWTFDLHDLAFEHVGLSRSYSSNAGKIKEKLQPAIDELEALGFLRAIRKEERYTKDGKTWKIRLVRHIKADAAPSALPDAAPSAAPAPLVGELAARGVHEETALELTRDYAAEVIGLRLEVFDWLTAKNDPQINRNPAGYLISSIRKQYPIPKGFVSSADRQRKHDAKSQKARQADDERLRKLNRAAREREERRKIDAYWNAMTPQAQAAFDLTAQAEADPETRQLLEGSMRKFGIKAIRDRAILKQLRDQGELPHVEM